MAGSGRYGRMVEYVDYHVYDPVAKMREARMAKEEADEKEVAPVASGPITGAPSDRQPRQKQEKKPKVKAVPVLLHIPEDLLERIDTIVDGLLIKASRRAWVMAQIVKGVMDVEKTPKELQREETRAIFINPKTGEPW